MSERSNENLHTVWKKEEGKEKRKRKKECRSSTYDAAVNRLMAICKAGKGQTLHVIQVQCVVSSWSSVYALRGEFHGEEVDEVGIVRWWDLYTYTQIYI